MIERFVSGIAGIPGLTSSQANTPEAKLAAIAEVLLAEHHLHKEAKAENDSVCYTMPLLYFPHYDVLSGWETLYDSY